MALLAVRSQLAAVDVSMTLRAKMTDICENRLGVTLRTCDTLVQSAQREARCIVIELWNSTNGFPAIDRVAILARNVQRAMRAVRCQCGLRLGFDSRGFLYAR